MSMNMFGDVTYNGVVNNTWMDHNDHMNLGYYLIVFDKGTESLFTQLGIGSSGQAKWAESMFTLETRVIYSKELRRDERFRIETRILGYDHNKIHYMHWMINDEDGDVCAINELLSVNVNMNSRRSTPFRDESLQQLSILSQRHKACPAPEEAGGSIRRIGFPLIAET